MSSPKNSIDWLAALGRLGPEDLRRISRLVDLMAVADRATGERVRSMLGATPEPWTHDEARTRCDAIIRDLELAAGVGLTGAPSVPSTERPT